LSALEALFRFWGRLWSGGLRPESETRIEGDLGFQKKEACRKHLQASFPPRSGPVSSGGSNGRGRRQNGVQAALRLAHRLSGGGAPGLNRKRGRKFGWRAPPAALPESSKPVSADDFEDAKARIAKLERSSAANRRISFFREVLDRELMAERRPQALDIVDLLVEGPSLTAGVFEIDVGLRDGLLLFQRPYEALRLGLASRLMLTASLPVLPPR
jgi:hypothetical protein